MKKLIAVLLVLISIVALASCSGGGSNNKKAPEKVVLENVYLSEKFAIPENTDIYNMYISGDRVFLKGSEEEHVVKDDGSEEYKYKEILYATDRSFKELESFFTFESEYFWDDETQESRSSFFDNAMPDGNGGIWVITSSYYSKPLEDGEWLNENNTELHHYGADGELIRTLDCKEIFSTIPDIDVTELNSLYVNSISQSGDGTVYIMTNNRLTAVSADGSVLKTKTLDGNRNFGAMAALEDGTVRVTGYDWSGEVPKLDVIDYILDTNEFKTICTLSTNDNVLLDAYGNIYTDDSYIVKRVDAATGEATPILDWINSDINCDRVFQITPVNGEFFTFEWDANYDKRSILHLTPAGEGEAIEKYVMTLAANTISSDLKSMIIDYNRSSADYRIQVKAYGWDEGASDKFDLDLLSGDVPDLICLDELNAEKYATKGLFADLGELIDADEDMSRDDFLPNVLKASEIKGKLYRLPTSFSARSLIGKTSVVGDKESWTWSDFLNVMKQYPDAEMLSEFSRATLMESFLPYIIGDFIDYNTGKSNFTDGNFANFLEYAKILPAEIDWEKYYESIDWEEYENRYKNNQVLLSVSYLSSFDGEYYSIENFGEPVSYVGFPTSSGNGNSLQFTSQFAIGAKSMYKEQAWDFFKMVFAEDYQTEYVWEIPVIKSAFDKKKQNAIDSVNGMNNEKDYPVFEEDIMPMPEVDVSEEVVEEIEVEASYVSDKMIGMPRPMPYDEEEDLEERKAKMLQNIEDVSRVLTTATSLTRYKDPMIKVIADECQPYFDGKKSLEETCKIIESRVNLYLAENM